MKTEELVAMLASGTPPVPRRAASRRLALSVWVALPLSVGWMLWEYGVRSDLVEAMFWPMFWGKLVFPLAIAAAGFAIVHRLARPGVPVRGRFWLALAMPVLMVWALALLAWFGAPPAERLPMLWGQTWRTCVLSIGSIALPLFVASMVALRGLAPTRPALTGAVAGVMAGAIGAAIYALHCPELAAPFLAVWYVAGIALPGLVGAAIGPRLLRW